MGAKNIPYSFVSQYYPPLIRLTAVGFASSNRKNWWDCRSYIIRHPIITQFIKVNEFHLPSGIIAAIAFRLFL